MMRVMIEVSFIIHLFTRAKLGLGHGPCNTKELTKINILVTEMNTSFETLQNENCLFYENCLFLQKLPLT